MHPKIYVATDHDIDPNAIDADALYVLKRLHDAGYTAYLVGGSVRDLLVKCTPKDFDISTSAKPEEIKHIFGRQCMLIGRRFRLAHIRFGKKIIEVSTFRSGDNEDVLIIRDNEWGSPEEDVLRRDFTVNGLFYDPTTHSIIDYVGGWEDIHNEVIRSIGDPQIRFKQDPVRMIRLLKFRARYGFKVTADCKEALYGCRDEIMKSSPARILEEMYKMLESGASAPFFSLLMETGFLGMLFPMIANYFNEGLSTKVYQYLSILDQIIAKNPNKKIDRSVLTACLIFPIVEQKIQNDFIDKDNKIHLGEVIMLTTSIIREVVTSSFTQFPRRISTATNFILHTQYRFTPPSGKTHYRPRLFQHNEFHSALTFLKIRALVDKEIMPDYQDWKKKYKHFQSEHDHRGPHHPPPEKKRRRRRRTRD